MANQCLVLFLDLSIVVLEERDHVILNLASFYQEVLEYLGVRSQFVFAHLFGSDALSRLSGMRFVLCSRVHVIRILCLGIGSIASLTLRFVPILHQISSRV